MLTRIVVALMASLASAVASAEAPPVLQGDQITEAAIVEALGTPKTTRPMTRGIGAASGARKTAAAALLITFETNATALTAQAKRELEVVAQALNTKTLATYNFVIEGHADPRGVSQANMRLSQGRAESVRQFLVHSGVSEDRLKTVGKGDTEPLNTDNPAAPENRRVTFVNLFNAQ